MDELAYSFHLGNDKNKTKKARQIARESKTGTTSFNNNGIQTFKQLSKVFNHNYRMYDNRQDEIVILKGSNNLINDVKGLYLELFEESKIKYNEKQTRSDRKIDDYFTHISNNDKTDLACEIIVELGDMDFWENKDKDYRSKMNDVFNDQIKYLEKIVPSFKVASAVVHYDEHSPHLHIIGVPFKKGNKNGMEIIVGKSAIFTKDSLKVIQDKMREHCIETFNRVYSDDYLLKKKQKGKNHDNKVSEMTDYREIKAEIAKKQEQLNIANDKSKELDIKSNEIKNVVANLKQSKINKENYILTTTEKENIVKYIDEVSITNDNYKELNKLTVIFDNIKTELENSKKKINNLIKDNDELSKISIRRGDQILELEKQNKVSTQKSEYWEDRFFGFIDFIRIKLRNKYERKNYMKMAYELHNKDVIDKDVFSNLYKVFKQSEKNIKNNDDLEL